MIDLIVAVTASSATAMVNTIHPTILSRAQTDDPCCVSMSVCIFLRPLLPRWGRGLRGRAELDHDRWLMFHVRVGSIGQALACAGEARWNSEQQKNVKYAANQGLNIKRPM
ncbi:MAG: hypothetical protein ACTICQ_10250 [Glutamicibacter arilaitensis]|uniref:hypothetical protein n=1 Tax=Glutamicibacter arilaitensis TaxID=256701 RepID=UPI003FB97473